MPVFDFNEKKEEVVKAERSYKLDYSSERTPSADHPIMILEDIPFPNISIKAGQTGDLDVKELKLS